MTDPMSRLKKEDKELEDRWDWMREAKTFSRILEMKLRFEIERKLLRSSVDREGFLRRGWAIELVGMTMEKTSFRKREIDKVCYDWTKFAEAEFQKESLDGIKRTLFIFRGRNEFVNSSESGWNKIDQLWRWGRWKKKRIRESDGKTLVRMRSILSLK